MSGFGIDLGTANTVIGDPERGIILNEPSVMLTKKTDPHKAVLVGHQARELIGRTPNGYQTVRPLRDGVIVDLEQARAYIVAIIRTVTPNWRRYLHSKAVIAVPAGATALERRALLEVAHEAGLRKVALILEPVAGAIGAGVDPLEPRAHLVVDLGGGTAEITGFCFGGVLTHRSCRVAGDELTNTLYQYLRVEHQLVVGELTAEKLKLGMQGDDDSEPLVVEGRDAATGRARLVTLETEEVVDALRPTTMEIVNTLTACLEDLPAQAVGDVMSEGLLAMGGGSMLRGFTQLLEESFGFPVKTAERPLTCVAEGATKCLDRPDILAVYGE